MWFSNKIKLTQDNIALRPLMEEDINDLVQLASDERIWRYHKRNFHIPTAFKTHWFDKAMQQHSSKKRYVFAVLQNDKPVGSTSFYEMNEKMKRLTIGYTWFHPDYWGTALNPITKQLLLSYSFETLRCNRVAFCIDSDNIASLKAVEKIGAKKEGVLRNHIIRADGSIRHSVYYSVIIEDWLETKKNLTKLIAKHTNH